jgi:hypothetical protein
MKSGVEFISTLVVRGDRLYIAGSPDVFEPYSPFTRLFAYYGDRDQPWTKHDVQWWTVALEMSRREDGGPIHCALSQEGQVELISQGAVVVEKIADAGGHQETKGTTTSPTCVISAIICMLAARRTGLQAPGT